MEGSDGRIHKPRLLTNSGEDINPRLFVGGEWAHRDIWELQIPNQGGVDHIMKTRGVCTQITDLLHQKAYH